MGEVLSQNEIDSLLQALSSGELDAEDMKVKDEKQVKNYDFTRPAKFSKEHLRTLEIIFEHYGRLLSTNLPVYLRKTVQVEVMNSEAVTYSEFTNALSNPVLLGLVNVSPLSGSIIIELADNLGYAIVDRMLGGLGTPLDKPRDFSEIELLILERIYNVCVSLLPEPWSSVCEISPRLEDYFADRDDRTCDITYQDWRCGRSYEYLSSVSDIGKCHGQAEYEVLVFQSSGT